MDNSIKAFVLLVAFCITNILILVLMFKNLREYFSISKKLNNEYKSDFQKNIYKKKR